MKRLGMFAWFFFLMSMCLLRIDDGEGAGGGDGDIFDEDLDDISPKDEGKKEGDGEKDKAKPPAKETTPDPDKMLLEEIRQERALGDITKSLKAEHDGFDMEKVIAKLKEMEKEKPGSGNSLFNKAGIELIHLKHFANQESDGEFDASGGRGSKAPTSDELIEKINSGKATPEEEFSFYKQYM